MNILHPRNIYQLVFLNANFDIIAVIAVDIINDEYLMYMFDNENWYLDVQLILLVGTSNTKYDPVIMNNYIKNVINSITDPTLEKEI